MNRYNKNTAKWQQQNKEEQKMNKTEFIKVRCTLEEKQRIKSKAESTGRKFSDYCREILLNGEDCEPQEKGRGFSEKGTTFPLKTLIPFREHDNGHLLNMLKGGNAMNIVIHGMHGIHF